MTILEQTRREAAPAPGMAGFAKPGFGTARFGKPAKRRAPRQGESPFDVWEEISRRVRAAKMIRLFLDFDGTLVAYGPSPDEVRLSAPTRSVLRRLARHASVQTAIVSGRRRSSLAQFVKIPGIELLGLYGWESAENSARLPSSVLTKLSRARAFLAKLRRSMPEIHVEDKGVSLAVHFRGASEQSRRLACARLRAAAARLRPELHVIRANATWEIAPRQVRGKGAAVRATLQGVRTPFLPIYVGDDLTDEPAFASLRQGITVRVGPARRTKARFRLADVGEVCTFLKRLEEELS
jgi:trehalose 6-phosphate phosphatase